MARPTNYRKEYAEQARKLCLLGYIDKQLADFFNVSEQTINTWKNKHPEFLESIKRGKDIADAEVVDSLFKRAKGYTYRKVEIKVSGGKTTKTIVEEERPPDPTSIIFLLKNRQPKYWRDKQTIEQEQQEPTPVTIVVNAVDARKDNDNQS